jgi:transaldolase
MTMNSLEQLRQFTTVVADTGDFHAMRAYAPRDATTNPTLIVKAVARPEYAQLIDDIVRAAPAASLDEQIDQLLVRFGCEILSIIPGRVSTEVDARLSFDTEATMARARRLIALYQAAGIDRSRVLIKIAATWEGIRAAEQLEADGVRCNLTLMFSLPQAVACADAMVSPFVGRIMDWYKRRDGRDFEPEDDPGVQSVRRIYAYFKHFGHATEVMGASFRNIGQVLALAGCDLLTISPELLEQLRADSRTVERRLRADVVAEPAPERLRFDERAFRFAMNEDAMASEKLAEGIRLFVADALRLDALVAARASMALAG